MSRKGWLSGALAMIILMFVLCPAILDFGPIHWAYGQIGCLLGATGGSPWILRPGSTIFSARLADKIAVFSPRRVRRYPGDMPGFCRRLVAETGRDCRAGTKTIVDTTRADRARMMQPAREQLLALSGAGVIRIVIWDGAHHLPALPLAPDVLIVPVLRDFCGDLWVCHGTIADAVPVEDLLKTMDQFGCDCWVVAVPRLGTLAKADRSLQYTAKAAVLEISAFHGPISAKRGTKGRYLSDGIFLGDDGTLIWGTEIQNSAEASALLKGAVRAGARQVLCPVDPPVRFNRLATLCHAEGLVLNRFGFPAGARDIFRSRLFRRDLKRAVEDHPPPDEESLRRGRWEHAR